MIFSKICNLPLDGFYPSSIISVEMIVFVTYLSMPHNTACGKIKLTENKQKRKIAVVFSF